MYNSEDWLRKQRKTRTVIQWFLQLVLIQGILPGNVLILCRQKMAMGQYFSADVYVHVNLPMLPQSLRDNYIFLWGEMGEEAGREKQKTMRLSSGSGLLGLPGACSEQKMVSR